MVKKTKKILQPSNLKEAGIAYYRVDFISEERNCSKLMRKML